MSSEKRRRLCQEYARILGGDGIDYSRMEYAWCKSFVILDSQYLIAERNLH